MAALNESGKRATRLQANCERLDLAVQDLQERLSAVEEKLLTPDERAAREVQRNAAAKWAEEQVRKFESRPVLIQPDRTLISRRG